MEIEKSRGERFFGDLLPEEYFIDKEKKRRQEEMKRIQHVTETVRIILENHPETRSNDNALFIKVVERVNKELIYLPIVELLMNTEQCNVPRFESVRRARQKLQAMHPELRASEAVQEARAENEVIVREYATDCAWR